MPTSGWQRFKRELIVGLGSVTFLLGVFAAIILLVSKVETQKALWITVSLASALLGWGMVRTQSKDSVDAFKQMFNQLLSIIFSPVNWLNW